MPQVSVNYDVIVGVDSLHVRDYFKETATIIGTIHTPEKVHITKEYDTGEIWGYGVTSVGTGWICERTLDDAGKPVWFVNPVKPDNPPPDPNPDPDPTPASIVHVVEIGPKLETLLRQIFFPRV